jgi:hypothetical protein
MTWNVHLCVIFSIVWKMPAKLDLLVHLCSMIIFLLVPTVSAVVQISLITQVAANLPVQVLWTRAAGDPRVWNLRLAMDGNDMGVVTTIHAENNLTGVGVVTFPGVGFVQSLRMVSDLG